MTGFRTLLTNFQPIGLEGPAQRRRVERCAAERGTAQGGVSNIDSATLFIQLPAHTAGRPSPDKPSAAERSEVGRGEAWHRERADIRSLHPLFQFPICPDRKANTPPRAVPFRVEP